MNVLLYLNTAERERLDKSSHLQLLFSLEGYLRAPSSIINPSMMIEFDLPEPMKIVNEDDAILADADNATITAGHARITEANYMYIPEFGRFYFITDIVVAKARQYIVTGSVDVLMSFKDNILEQECFIERNEYRYNIMEEDPLLPLRFRKSVTEEEVSTDGLTNIEFHTNWNDCRFVLSMVTDYPYPYLPIEPPLNSGLPEIDPQSFVANGSFCNYRMRPDRLQDLANAVIKDDTLNTYIRTIIALPFVPFGESENNDVHKGHYNPYRPDRSKIQIVPDDPNIPRYYLRGDLINGMSGYLVLADFRMPSATDYLSFAPYTHYELFLPFLGYTEINYQLVAGHRLIVYYSVDYSDGSGSVTIYDMTDKKVIFSSGCQLGVKIGLSSTNLREITTQRASENINLALNLIASIGTMAYGVASYNPVAVAGGALNFGRSVTSYVNANMNMFDKANATYSSPANAVYSPMKVRLRITRTRTIANLDLGNFAHVAGRVLRTIEKLSTLYGFTIATSMHLENINCFAREADMIKELFATGVIL